MQAKPVRALHNSYILLSNYRCMALQVISMPLNSLTTVIALVSQLSIVSSASVFICMLREVACGYTFVLSNWQHTNSFVRFTGPCWRAAHSTNNGGTGTTAETGTLVRTAGTANTTTGSHLPWRERRGQQK